MNTEAKKPRYGNWVSTQLIRKCVAMVLLFGIIDAALWLFVQRLLILKILFALPMAFFIVSIIYFYHARRLFAAEGGDIQNKILDLLVSRVDWSGDGSALDIGCGSGALTTRLAKKYGSAKITGVDNWGGGWDYCQKQCEENARLEGVAYQTEFQRASASKLPFPDDTFDLAVSNLTFHEVKDSESRLDAVKESLRVVKKGGKFVFQDLFLIRRYYGTPEELIAAVKACGVRDVRFVDTSASSFIPKALKLPFMVGTLGLIHGEK